MYQSQQLQVAGQDVAVFFQLAGNEVQCVLPEITPRGVQQHHRYQWALARLDKGEDFQGFVQCAEAAWAQHQGIRFLDEEQLANKEKVKRQQLVGAVHGGVGMLLEGQGNVETQAVFDTCAFVRGGHDAAASTGDDHQVGTCQGRTKLSGQCIHGVFDRGAGGAEYGDLAPSLVLFKGAEGMVQFAQGLQGDLGVPAVAVVVGHAQDGQHHVAVQRQVGAIGRNQRQLFFQLAQVDSIVLEVAR
ncbi:hypothetical protein D3C79_621400 [compost metagenome]